MFGYAIDHRLRYGGHVISEQSTAFDALPLIGQQPVERSDAARNRAKIITAAAEVLAERGAAGLSVDEVAGRAGVGVGTIYRRFGDRSGLLWSLLDDRERSFQDAFMTGPPPLGPGASACERLRAFLHALLAHIVEHLDLIVSAQARTHRQHSGPYGVYRSHVMMLLEQLVPGEDTPVLADMLLAPLQAGHIDRQLRDYGYDLARIRHGIDRLLGVVGG